MYVVWDAGVVGVGRAEVLETFVGGQRLSFVVTLLNAAAEDHRTLVRAGNGNGDGDCGRKLRKVSIRS